MLPSWILPNGNWNLMKWTCFFYIRLFWGFLSPKCILHMLRETKTPRDQNKRLKHLIIKRLRLEVRRSEISDYMLYIVVKWFFFFFYLLTYPYTHSYLTLTEIIILTCLLKYLSMKSDICYIYRRISSILARGTLIHIWATLTQTQSINLTPSWQHFYIKQNTDRRTSRQFLFTIAPIFE